VSPGAADSVIGPHSSSLRCGLTGSVARSRRPDIITAWKNNTESLGVWGAQVGRNRLRGGIDAEIPEIPLSQDEEFGNTTVSTDVTSAGESRGSTEPSQNSTCFTSVLASSVLLSSVTV
jgi:hypothetical protein